MKKKQFIVIGLGRFGSSVAKTLYSLGNEVLAIDFNEELVQDISDSVTHVVQLDATDENCLRSLGVSNFDGAVVAIGADVQASIMATLLLKELGVKNIVAKANNEMHAKVLSKIGADRIVFPERDMGVRVANNIVSSNILDFIEISPDYNIAEIVSPKEWHGRSIRDIDMRAQFGISVIAIKKQDGINVSPGADDIIEPNDVVVAIGGSDELSRLESKPK